ncbi:MAG: MFS transporter [Rhizomicrobium sp.]
MLRLVTGLGVGGTLFSINTIVVEYSSQKRKDITVAVMTVGYPIGATIVGIASVYLIEVFGWRSVFVFGGAFFRRTSMICGAYFLTMLSFNFLFNWTPKVLVDQGFSLRFGISGSVLMNLGSVAGRPSARTGDKAFRTACARYSAAPIWVQRTKRRWKAAASCSSDRPQHQASSTLCRRTLHMAGAFL